MKQTLKTFILSSALAIFCSGCAEKEYTLFADGSSRYTIVVSPDASRSERTAADELKQFLLEISGAELDITDNLKCRGRKIFIGYNSEVGRHVGEKDIPDDDESFTWESVGKNIFIYGGKQRGTLYGVYSFLEEEFGCRWYTPDFSRIPFMNEYRFGRLSHSESPAVKYRYSNYYDVTDTPQWSARNRENTKWDPSVNSYGNLEAYWSAHTFGQFVPESEYFESHPEYFAWRGGKRLGKNTQLCLSNPDVLKICTERLAEVMASKPDYRIYSLSQNDNYNFCECDQCRKLEEQYGGHSGLILWFVNQAADVVKEKFPDKYVGTFAYQWGRKPPVGITPRDNVVIRLCSIECCFAHPLEAGCPQNEEFMEDLRGWKAIAPHLFIWDYIVNYAQFLAPFPNFSVLAANIRTFRDHNAIGIFEEAQYQSPGSEFAELRTWVVTKLLWNPEQDADSLAYEFIHDYYGPSAPKIWEYYLLCQGLVKHETHFNIYIKADNSLYTDEFVSQSATLLDDALHLADTPELADRVQKVRMQILYLKSMRNKQESLSDGTWNELRTLMLRFDAKPSEWRTIDRFIEEFETASSK